MHACLLASCIEKRLKKKIVLVHRVEFLVRPDLLRLSPSTLRLLFAPNAGGSSIWSEALSCEILGALFGATLLRTEMEIDYSPPSKITDYSVCLYGRAIGVSVTRAVRHNGVFDLFDAHRLLTKKLWGIRESSRCVVPEHSWDRQILHLFAQNETVALVLEIALSETTDDALGDTVVIITVCPDDEAPWVYYGPKRIQGMGHPLPRFPPVPSPLLPPTHHSIQTQ